MAVVYPTQYPFGWFGDMTGVPSDNSPGGSTVLPFALAV